METFAFVEHLRGIALGLLTPVAAHAVERYSEWNHFVQTANNCSYGRSKIRDNLGSEHGRATTRNNQRVGTAACPASGDAGNFRNVRQNYIRTTAYIVMVDTGVVCSSIQAWNTNGPAARQIATAPRRTCNSRVVTIGQHEIYRPNWGFFSVAETVTPVLTFVTPV